MLIRLFGNAGKDLCPSLPGVYLNALISFKSEIICIIASSLFPDLDVLINHSQCRLTE